MKKSEKKADEAGLVDMEEAIALLKTTRQTFYRWLRAGKFKGMKVGRQWRFYREDVDRFLKGEGPRTDLGSLKPLIETLRRKLEEAGRPVTPLEGDEDIQASMLMALAAVHFRASDLHLEPQKIAGEEKGIFRIRVDGVLHTLAEFDLLLLRPLVERWKIMANVNLLETKKPQDARIHLNIGGTPYDIRICFVPTCMGEAFTARVLDSKGPILSLDLMPFAARDRAKLDKCLALPWGMMVVTGPVGCGKTTLLYACLNQRARPEIKVMSVEDPVEFILPWVTQIPVRVAEGLTFAAALRSIMRCDPDVVMIGEIRDGETLKVAQQMALTGHLVLTTLHTQNAVQALKRMMDIGADAFAIADSVKLVLGQRLLRKLCSACAKPCEPDPDLLKRAMGLAGAGGVDQSQLGGQWKKAAGCPACRSTGYRGRTLVAEALEVTPEVAAALRRGEAMEEIQALAVRQGMTTMQADGVRRAAAGETTLEEVLRVLSE